MRETRIMKEPADAIERGKFMIPLQEADEPRPSSPCCIRRITLAQCTKFLLKNIVLFLMIAAIIGGLGLGALLRTIDPPLNPLQLVYLAFPGELLMRMLRCLILPVIVSTIISGVASLGERSGKLGGTALVYYLATTLIAVILGILLVTTIRPGQGVIELNGAKEAIEISYVDSLLDLMRNLFPENLISTTFEQTKSLVTHIVINNNGSHNQTIPKHSLVASRGMNVLGIIVFSIAFGLAVGNLGQAGEPVIRFFQATGDATMKLVYLVMLYSPIGILFLIATEVVAMNNPDVVLRQLGLFLVTVITGLVVHGFLILPGIYWVVTRRNPFKYMSGLAPALVTAFGTASSSATLPITMRCLEKEHKIDSRVTRFVIPVGATINMDGTALYEAVAGLFIAQLNGIEMDLITIATTALTATLASVGAAGVPGAGFVTLVIVISALGLPADDIGKILAVDWFLDRCRTAMNVWGDSVGAAVVQTTCQSLLNEDIEEISDESSRS